MARRAAARGGGARQRRTSVHECSPSSSRSGGHGSGSEDATEPAGRGSEDAAEPAGRGAPPDLANICFIASLFDEHAGSTHGSGIVDRRTCEKFEVCDLGAISRGL